MRRALALVAVALLVVVAVVVLQRTVFGKERATERGPTGSPDWQHALQVVATLKASPPNGPVVYLLGGSAARESTISDKSWAAQVRRLGGLRARTYNLGSSQQTYAQDIVIVNQLPVLPGVVLIGVDLGRYVRVPLKGVTPGGEQPDANTGAQAGARLPTRAYNQHHYSVRHILTNAQKRQCVDRWATSGYRFFEKNFAGNAAQLDQLIATCQTRGLHPVLLELPLNQPIIGHSFDAACKTYRDSCRALAKKYGIPNIDFVDKLHLVNGDFYDLFHLIEPGRVKWQLRLSKTVVSLLARYGMESP